MTSAVIAPDHTRSMARSNEDIRQWQILRSLASSRLGIAVGELAAEHGVTTRTIRRDLSALGRAGFPLYQEEGSPCLLWKRIPVSDSIVWKAEVSCSNCSCRSTWLCDVGS